MFVIYAQDFTGQGYKFLQKYSDDKIDLSALWYDLALVKGYDCTDKAYHDFLVDIVVCLVNDQIYKDDQIILEYLRC